MIAELGHFLLILSFILCVLGVILPQLGLILNNTQLQTTAISISIVNCGLILLSFICLIYSYIASDFSVINVWQNSHYTKPLIYKISGAWSNHEGSLLLWLSLLSIMNYFLGFHNKKLPLALKIQTLILQHFITGGFLIFVLLTSNPFGRIFPVPLEGKGLNPLLQDPALAIHPPLLYIGYVLTSIIFSMSLSYLITPKTYHNLGALMRSWVISSWIFLTLGISMGSWWAYYELGWGGFWFWDPVENASLMPWLIVTALLHSVMVTEKRDTLKKWTVLLAILSFSLSLVGTFLVRSGILTSVHAFSVDPQRGLFILVLISIYTLGATLIYSLKIHKLKSTYTFSFLSKEGSIIINNYFMMTLLITVLTGTLYPLFLEVISGIRISVGAPFFNITFIPFIIPLFIILPLGPLLKWKKANIYDTIAILALPFIGCCIIFTISLLSFKEHALSLTTGLCLGFWLIGASIITIKKTTQNIKKFFVHFLQNLSQLAGPVAHIGVGILSIGIVCTSLMSEEKIITLSPGTSVSISDYTITFTKIRKQKIDNYLEEAAILTVTDHNHHLIETLTASKRLYDKPKTVTTEVAFLKEFRGNYYITLHDQISDNSYNFRLYHHAFVNFIWLGTIIMAFGGMLSLLRRRKYVKKNL